VREQADQGEGVWALFGGVREDDVCCVVFQGEEVEGVDGFEGVDVVFFVEFYGVRFLEGVEI
jgi:hypothetical protein